MFDLHSKARQRLLGNYFTNATARFRERDLAERLRTVQSSIANPSFR
jgi:hypothetical protein